jgi:hypothetical protein
MSAAPSRVKTKPVATERFMPLDGVFDTALITLRWEGRHGHTGQHLQQG